MFIADTQVHIWAASTAERPWPPPLKPPRAVPLHRRGPFAKDDTFSKEDLLREMDAAGVHRALIHPPSWEGERNDLGLEAARLYPDRFAVMGRLDIDSPHARGQVKTWREQEPGMLGLRITFKSQGNPAEDWYWAEAESAGVPIMVTLYTPHLRAVEQAAERHPGLKLVIDHLGIVSGRKDDEAFVDLDQLLAVAKRPNIAVKVCSLPSYTADSYPYRRVHPHIRRVYDAFGPKRMFWGTDLTKLRCTYRQAITMFTEEIPWLSAEDKEWIMGRALCEWTGWKLPSAPFQPANIKP